nr:unnamed protein product [Callosobruchus chinensis]
MSLLRELQVDPNDFQNYERMDEDTFEHLFNIVGPH